MLSISNICSIVTPSLIQQFLLVYLLFHWPLHDIVVKAFNTLTDTEYSVHTLYNELFS